MSSMGAKKVNPVKTCPKCDHPNPEDLNVCEECGANLAELADDGVDPMIGALLVSKFRISELIGQGAMGRVYKATQEPINRQVAVKILHAHLLEDQRVAKRFRREAEAASRFTHPNSIGIFDFGQTDDGSLYIAMEYITGEDLAEVIAREAPLEAERAVRIATQTLSALQLAHANSIIHRDLKPENIMLAELPGHKDFAKVCDFGIAKIQQPTNTNESALTMFGMICGTPYYMSPEQAKGEELDGRTDLYSMGVILYEMLTGEVPFRGSTPVEVIARHLTDQPVPPSKLRPDAKIPKMLEEVVMRSLSKNREGRFSSAQELSQELERALKEAEFQADLERVLQEAEEPPLVLGMRPTGAVPVVASPKPMPPVAGPKLLPPLGMPPSTTPRAGGVMTRPFDSMSSPPVGTPALRPMPQGPILGQIKPVPQAQFRAQKSHLSQSRSEAPSPLALDSLPEPVYGGKSKGRWVFLLILLIGAAFGGYALWSNQQKNPNQLPFGKPKTVKNQKKPRRHPPRRVKKIAKIIPPRRIKKIVKRKDPALARQKQKYEIAYRRFRLWMKKHKISKYDLSRKYRRLYLAAIKRGKHKKYDTATENFETLSSRYDNLSKLPRSVAQAKFKRLQRLHRKAIKKKLLGSSIKKVIENDIFPQIYRAFMAGDTKKMNKYMNEAFRLLR